MRAGGAGCALGCPRRAPLSPLPPSAPVGAPLTPSPGRCGDGSAPGAAGTPAPTRPAAAGAERAGAGGGGGRSGQGPARASRGRCSTAGRRRRLTRGSAPPRPAALPAGPRGRPGHSGAAGSAQAEQGTCPGRERPGSAGRGAAVGGGPVHRAAGEGPWGREGPARGGRGKVTRKRRAPAGPSGLWPRWCHPRWTGVRCRGAPPTFRTTPRSGGCGGARRRGGTGRVSPSALAAHLLAGPGRAARRGHRALPASADVRGCRRAARSGRARESAAFPAHGVAEVYHERPGSKQPGRRLCTAPFPSPVPSALRLFRYLVGLGFGEVVVVLGLGWVFFYCLLFEFDCGLFFFFKKVVFPNKCGLFFLAANGKK